MSQFYSDPHHIFDYLHGLAADPSKAEEEVELEMGRLLQPFMQTKTWQQLKGSDKKLLSALLVTWGEMQLEKEDCRACDTFNMANRICSDDASLAYRQASAFAAQSDNLRYLQAACKALEVATTLDSSHKEAWKLWGNVLLRRL